MRHLIGAALTTCMVAACGSSSQSRSTATPTTATVEPVVAPRAAATGADPQATEGPPPPAPRCRVTVTDTEGCGPRDIEVLIAPVRTRIENCRGASGGKLRITVRRAAGKLAFAVQPGTSLDPTERQCVLDALAGLQVDESSTAWSGLNVTPTGFTSLITIEW